MSLQETQQPLNLLFKEIWYTVVVLHHEVTIGYSPTQTVPKEGRLRNHDTPVEEWASGMTMWPLSGAVGWHCPERSSAVLSTYERFAAPIIAVVEHVQMKMDT